MLLTLSRNRSLRENIRLVGIAVCIFHLFKPAHATGKPEALFSPEKAAELHNHCNAIEKIWPGVTDIESTLKWMEKVMQVRGASYSHQQPISKSIINYFFKYEGFPALNSHYLTRLKVKKFRDLNPYLPEPLDTYPQYLSEIKKQHVKYGGSTIIYPQLVEKNEIVASRGIDPSHIEKFWSIEDLNMPPSYIQGILNEFEQEQGKKGRWRFTRL